MFGRSIFHRRRRKQLPGCFAFWAGSFAFVSHAFLRGGIVENRRMHGFPIHSSDRHDIGKFLCDGLGSAVSDSVLVTQAKRASPRSSWVFDASCYPFRCTPRIVSPAIAMIQALAGFRLLGTGFRRVASVVPRGTYWPRRASKMSNLLKVGTHPPFIPRSVSQRRYQWSIGNLPPTGASALEISVKQSSRGKAGQDFLPSKLPPADSAVATTEHAESEHLTTILQCLQTMKNGDFSVRLPVSWTGLPGKIADNFNEIVIANEQMAFELKRVGQTVGKEGKTRERLRVEKRRGAWDDMEVSVNTLVEDLLRPTTEVTRAIAAVAQGNLTQTVRLDVDGRPLEGEFLRSANIVNTMIQQLGVFTAEVTRVAREVGTDGKLGGQALVPGVAGTWKDLTDSVNSMASNLTGQVRNIAEVATAVASGDLSRKITVDVRGEILQLKEAINTMVDQLSAFASEVTRVAREVGTDGKLGGQAVVVGVAGTWKDLTDSVNAMAGNLTAQVRNIAEVTTAVARGDLSRKITVDVKGEILELKDTINTMVDQLNAFAGEVTRVAREVGTEGKLG